MPDALIETPSRQLFESEGRAAIGTRGSYHTRFGNLDDVEQIVPLFDRYRQFYGEPALPVAARQFLTDRIVLGESQIIVAENEQEVIGFTQLFPSFSSVTLQRLWILNDLYVHEGYRGLGVGRALLRAAADLGTRTGAKQLFIEGALENRTARGLYEDFGFRKNSNYVYYHFSLTPVSYHVLDNEDSRDE